MLWQKTIIKITILFPLNSEFDFEAIFQIIPFYKEIRFRMPITFNEMTFSNSLSIEITLKLYLNFPSMQFGIGS